MSEPPQEPDIYQMAYNQREAEKEKKRKETNERLEAIARGLSSSIAKSNPVTFLNIKDKTRLDLWIEFLDLKIDQSKRQYDNSFTTAEQACELYEQIFNGLKTALKGDEAEGFKKRHHYAYWNRKNFSKGTVLKNPSVKSFLLEMIEDLQKMKVKTPPVSDADLRDFNPKDLKKYEGEELIGSKVGDKGVIDDYWFIELFKWLCSFSFGAWFLLVLANQDSSKYDIVKFNYSIICLIVSLISGLLFVVCSKKIKHNHKIYFSFFALVIFIVLFYVGNCIKNQVNVPEVALPQQSPQTQKQTTQVTPSMSQLNKIPNWLLKPAFYQIPTGLDDASAGLKSLKSRGVSILGMCESKGCDSKYYSEIDDKWVEDIRSFLATDFFKNDPEFKHWAALQEDTLEQHCGSVAFDDMDYTKELHLYEFYDKKDVFRYALSQGEWVNIHKRLFAIEYYLFELGMRKKRFATICPKDYIAYVCGPMH